MRDYTPGGRKAGKGGGGVLLNNVLYGEVPPLGLNPYTFIVEGARRVCLGLEPLRINFNVTQFNAPVLLLTQPNVSVRGFIGFMCGRNTRRRADSCEKYI